MENPAAFTQPDAPPRHRLLSSLRSRLRLMIAVSGAVALLLWGALFYLATATRRHETALAARQVKSQFIAELAAQAQQLNAPGNNVLEKSDVPAERGNFKRRREEYRRFMVRASDALSGDGDLTTNFRTVQAEIEQMNRLTDTVLSAAESQGQAGPAGTRDSAGPLSEQAAAPVAQMNQAFHRASRALREMEATERERIREMSGDIADFSRLLTLVSLALLLVALGALTGLGVQLLRSIARALDESGAIAASLATGDPAVRFTPPPEISVVPQAVRDLEDPDEQKPGAEISAVPQALQSLADDLHERELQLPSPDESADLQPSMMPLSDQAKTVAPDELTRAAEILVDPPGAATDSFNFTPAELRQLIGQVQAVTARVTSAASVTVRTADEVAADSRARTTQLLHTAETISEMVRSIQDVSENANVSARVAQQAVSTARHGSEAVRHAVQGLQRIRAQVQESARRIRQLDASSQEISEIVQLMQDLTDRTSIQALNASIQAAMAGESGRGCALAAEEVERLAARSAGATRRMAELVSIIQTGTRVALSDLEESAREVVAGAHQAGQAGQVFDRIETVSHHLAEVTQTILQAAREQARNSEAVTQTMQHIAANTPQAAGAQQASANGSDLSQLADELRASVSAFGLSVSSGAVSAEPMADERQAKPGPDGEGDQQS